MHIGDKVRLLHDKQSGVIVRMIRPDLAEVEIEDGFTIPVLAKELVIINNHQMPSLTLKETSRTTGKSESGNAGHEVLAAKGIYLAFMPQSEVLLEALLVNNTDFTIAFTLSKVEGAQVAGIISGILKSKDTLAFQSIDKRNPEQWPKLRLEVLYFHRGLSSYKPPITLDFEVSKKWFTAAAVEVPVLKKPGHYIQLDAKPEQQKQASTQLRPEDLFKPKKSESLPKATPLAFETEVDLHIEKLVPDPRTLSPAEMLALQISRFEQALDQALNRKQASIIFIHGVGNGVLRTELHKRLSRNKYIRFFEDAQREKFGFGATKVQIH